MSLPPHSWHFISATSSFTVSVRQDWNENENSFAARTQAGTWSKSPSFPQEAASAWTRSDQGNRSVGKAGETAAASMLRQSLSILKQFGSATRWVPTGSLFLFFVFVAERTYMFTKLQNFLGSLGSKSISLVDCRLLFSGLHIRLRSPVRFSNSFWVSFFDCDYLWRCDPFVTSVVTLGCQCSDGLFLLGKKKCLSCL